MKSKRVVPATYRVDILIPSTGSYSPYTSPRGTSFGMAESLASHLKRNGAGGRVVELPAGDVKEEWQPTPEYLAKVKASSPC